jgi:hypothetical protein
VHAKRLDAKVWIRIGKPVKSTFENYSRAIVLLSNLSVDSPVGQIAIIAFGVALAYVIFSQMNGCLETSPYQEWIERYSPPVHKIPCLSLNKSYILHCILTMYANSAV